MDLEAPERFFIMKLMELWYSATSIVERTGSRRQKEAAERLRKGLAIIDIQVTLGCISEETRDQLVGLIESERERIAGSLREPARKQALQNDFTKLITRLRALT